MGVRECVHLSTKVIDAFGNHIQPEELCFLIKPGVGGETPLKGLIKYCACVREY